MANKQPHWSWELPLSRGEVDIFYRPSQLGKNHGRAVCISHSINTFGNDMNPDILPQAMGKIVGQTFLNLDMATDVGEGKH